MTNRGGRLLLFTIFLSAGTSWAAEDPFVGKWKLNPDRSQLSDEMKVSAGGATNQFTLDFGGGQTETVTADATDQPGLYGTTISVAVEGPDSWKVVRKKDGHMMLIGLWKLSPDGSTLTDGFTGYRPDGTTSRLDYVYKRSSAGAGFIGTWDSVSEKVNSSYELEVAPYAGDGLAFINPAQKSTKKVRFDGKEYPNEGPNLPAGMTSSARRVNGQSLELTDKIGGRAIDTQQVGISPDGKTLTMSVLPAGRTKPNVLVFDRE